MELGYRSQVRAKGTLSSNTKVPNSKIYSLEFETWNFSVLIWQMHQR